MKAKYGLQVVYFMVLFVYKMLALSYNLAVIA